MSQTIACAFICSVSNPSAIASVGGQNGADIVPPQPLREFRGVWIATVANMNWPSKPGLSTAEQKAELTGLLDNAAGLNLNAVIFQVRPACDALYASKLEPWSEYLSGQMGQPPAPLYDPLAFAVEQAHQRGLELHAWFNPYRARYRAAKSTVSKNHISRSHPELVRKYGHYLWLDPGEESVQQHTRAVIVDVVKRYDIDGVHLDDYFYPYPEKDSTGKSIEFPDEPSWRKYRAGGGRLSRRDWRRKNVDDLIQTLNRNIKAVKPWVKFGISPFGIWRPGFPKEVTGLDAYDQIYADSRKWLANGWADYFAPQLYWSIHAKEQSYPLLLQWWAGQNTTGRHLWPGNNASKVGTSATNWTADEIVSQIRLTRKEHGATGNTLWNAASIARNTSGLDTALLKQVYAQPALVPASPWLDSQAPGKPKLSVGKSPGSKSWTLSWQSSGSERVWLWILQTRTGDKWTTEVLPAHVTSRVVRQNNSTPQPGSFAVTAVDRCGNTSLVSVEQIEPTGPGIPSRK